MNDPRPDIVTADGFTVHQGDRVWNYYDGEWGTIESHPDADGWFEFQPDTRRQRRSLDGSRVTKLQPGRSRVR